MWLKLQEKNQNSLINLWSISDFQVEPVFTKSILLISLNIKQRRFHVFFRWKKVAEAMFWPWNCIILQTIDCDTINFASQCDVEARQSTCAKMYPIISKQEESMSSHSITLCNTLPPENCHGQYLQQLVAMCGLYWCPVYIIYFGTSCTTHIQYRMSQVVENTAKGKTRGEETLKLPTTKL